MALSLAACGGSSTTTTTTDTTTTDTTTTTTTDAAQTFTLTNNVIDVITGGTGDDVIIGDANTSAADQVNGAAGADTFKVYGASTMPVLSSVEAVEVHHTAMANMVLSSGNLVGVTSVLINGAEASDKTITIKSGDTITLQAMTADASNDQVSVAAAATVTSATVNLVDNADTTGVIVDVLGTGIATLNLNETGSISKSYVDILADTASVTVSTVNITSTGKGIDVLDVDDATTIDASASTAAVNLDTAVNKVTITGGSGADDVTLDHANSVAFEGSISLGAGNDKLTITSLNGAADLVDSKVTLDGGEGDDTLTMINALADALTDLTDANIAKKGITGFEKLVVSDITTGQALDFTQLGISDVDLATGVGDDATFTIANNATITLGAIASSTDDTSTVTVSGAADAGANSDTFTLKLDALHAGSNITYGIMSVANVETVNIVSSSTKATVPTEDNDIDLVLANATTVVVTGNTGLLINGDPFDGAITSFDASALTGNLNVSFASGTGVTFTGSATGANTMVGSSNADLITGGTGGDSLAGTGGIDIVNLGAAGATDTVALSVTASADRDTINNFDTTEDIITVTATATAVATNASDAPVQQTVSALSASVTVADVDFVEFAFEGAVDLSTDLTGTTLLKAISNTSSAAAVAVDAEGDELYAIAYEGGDAFIYYIQDETASDSDSAAIQADEIFLVATVTDVAVGTLSMTNFDLL